MSGDWFTALGFAVLLLHVAFDRGDKPGGGVGHGTIRISSLRIRS
jgi:hypothetical protein